MKRAFVLLFAACSISAMAMNLNEELLDAVAQEDIERVTELIDRGADVNHANDYGNTALMIAAERGNLPLAQLLIARDADVNYENYDGNTALTMAALRGNLPLAQLLLDRGADVNHANNNGYTALIRAAIWNCPGIAQLLIERGADIYATSRDGKTVRDIALRNGRTKNVSSFVALIEKEDERRRCQSRIKGVFIPETNTTNK